MAKTPRCPFTHNLCAGCAPYRGRHHYLISGKQRQGRAQKAGERGPVNFKAMKKIAEPWAGKAIGAKGDLKIRLKVIDMESGASRICDFNDAKKWDWSKPDVWRLIDDRQVTSIEGLFEVLCYKAENGCEEVEIVEAPRFMLLGGG